MKKIISAILILYMGSGMNAQVQCDSLKKILAASSHDSTRLRNLVLLSEQCDPTEIASHCLPAIALADKLLLTETDAVRINKLLVLKSTACNNLGYAYQDKGDFDAALGCFNKALKIVESLQNDTVTSFLLLNIGFVYSHKGNNFLALEYFQRAHAKMLSSGNKDGAACALNNIAGIHRDLGNTQKALELFESALSGHRASGNFKQEAFVLNNIAGIYESKGDIKHAIALQEKSLKIRRKMGDRKRIAVSLANLAGYFTALNQYEKGIRFLKEAILLQSEVNDAVGMAGAYNGIGVICFKKGMLDSAITYYTKGLAIANKTGEAGTVINLQNNLGCAYFGKGDMKKARKFCTDALEGARRTGQLKHLYDASLACYKIDSSEANYKAAFCLFQEHSRYKERLMDIESEKAVMKSKFKNEFDRKEELMKEKEARSLALANEKSRNQHLVILGIALLLLCAVTFAVYAARTLRLTREQKAIIEEKQKNIIDSINYARKIQLSMITTEQYIDRTLCRLQHRSFLKKAA